MLQKIAAGLATSAIFAFSFAQAAGASSVIVSGNGAFSDSDVTVNHSTSNTVFQSNTSTVLTTINQHSNSGNNSSDFNTGNGGSSIQTGSASSDASVTVGGGSNTLGNSQCGCQNDPTDIFVGDNGAFSNTDVNVSKTVSNFTSQSNDQFVSTYLSQHNSTGHNSTSFGTNNFGGGIGTGSSNSSAHVTVFGGVNLH